MSWSLRGGFSLFMGMALGLVACRGVLGLEDRPSLEADAGAPPDAEAGPPVSTFCSKLMPPAQKCSDFDGEDPFAEWDNGRLVPDPGLASGGTFELLAQTEGKSLLARLPGVVDKDKRVAATLQVDTPTLGKRLLLEAKLKVVTEQIPGDSNVVLLSIAFGDEGAVIVYRDATGPAMAVVPDGKGVKIDGWAIGKTHTVGVVVSANKEGALTAQCRFDGEQSPELAVPTHFRMATRPPRIVVGPSALAPIGEVKVEIDDVTVYWDAK
jgi:hypothetical protein